MEFINPHNDKSPQNNKWSLPPSDNSEFLACELIGQLFDYENHYNNLQNKYKGLTVSWVIATFIGIGYLLKGLENNVSININLAIAGLCFIAANGTYLLWHLDGGLYHKLLESIFSEALALEQRYPSLGSSHQNIMKLHYIEHDPHIMHGLFYSSFILFLLTISFTCLSIYLYDISIWYFSGTILFIALGWTSFIINHKKALLSVHNNKKK